ncbi:hypothetical protein G6F62_005977 [Rhizopus arrhizus]|uniref:Uncharacterized protein n=1 Tax=Rhizopus oryzae TaxID=64495 RepID=A0A9P6X1A4_RHIOR|nr:hypothetical protein G6F23_007571 [Rhizopus arrhizus]KAG0761334.1 hypothetical protein G6F24_007651 [Rhizopus arrhizus]KAG0785179.1 hypothetical protein G6F21_009428 [Rhizopus arrhizus]KAG0794350.1 hypothetical protein G6F22_005378 [Rhizopus arrhizus]KAG0813927.1 hypothetical protein G6F20_005175 [Rhizopus arrhizus]
MDRQEQQKTLGIVPLMLKDEIKQKMKQKGFRMMLETPIESMNELTETFQIAKNQLPVFGFVLRGKDVIRVWLAMIKQEKEAQRDICFLHASSSKNDAEKEINLYQHLVLATKKNMNSESKTISSKSNALAQKKAAVRPTNRTALNTKDATRAPRSSQLNNKQTKVGNSAASRKTLDGVTNKSASGFPAKKVLSPKSDASKNTPSALVSTERTKRPGKSLEKTRVVAKPSPVQKKSNTNKTIEKKEEKERVQEEKGESIAIEEQMMTDPEELAVKERAEEAVLQPVSQLSTCSSTLFDEHDAEVAATTTRLLVNHENQIEPCSSVRSSSLSPNSVTSLPRPETPEISEIRSKFEQNIQISHHEKISPRPTSKVSNELVSRIKEMKPRDPAGSKVKSMVEFFMDENLNKWEF